MAVRFKAPSEMSAEQREPLPFRWSDWHNAAASFHICERPASVDMAWEHRCAAGWHYVKLNLSDLQGFEEQEIRAALEPLARKKLQEGCSCELPEQADG